VALPEARRYFGVHPFIEANSKAVFIRRTLVREKMDSAAKRGEGYALAREIFVPCIEANNQPTWDYRGFLDVHERHGIQMNEPPRSAEDFREGRGITWSDVPDGVVFRRLPHYAPVNEPDTWLLNVAKWKAHGMCLTQSFKNLQGLVVTPYVKFCSGWSMVTGAPEYMQPDIVGDVETRIQKLFDSHVKRGYSRYDSKASLGPIAQEIWAQKTCDNQSVLKPGLAMIEGIYARDGDGFGVGDDYLTNLVMFGKDQCRLDLLGGHEPGNVHTCRIAKERGLTDTFNPWEVPVYEWIAGEAVPRQLTDFPRTPLKTYYLQKEGEPLYHLVDEPFDYDAVKV